MLYILNGSIDSGKTTRMLEMYNKATPGTADGFISRKVYMDNKFVGYDIIRLSNNQKTKLALLVSEYHNEFAESFSYRRFVFSGEGFRFGESIIDELIANESQKDIYIDEIGPLEIDEQGFASIVIKALTSTNNLYITVRSSCLNEFICKYDITKYTLIK